MVNQFFFRKVNRHRRIQILPEIFFRALRHEHAVVSILSIAIFGFGAAKTRIGIFLRAVAAKMNSERFGWPP